MLTRNAVQLADRSFAAKRRCAATISASSLFWLLPVFPVTVVFAVTMLSAQSVQKPFQADMESMNMPLVAPLFIEEERFNSQLIMINAAEAATFADLQVRDASGIVIVTKRIDFNSHDFKSVPVAQLLRELPYPPRIGSIWLTPSKELKGMAIAAQLEITNTRNGSSVDEEVAMLGSGASSTLRAVTDSRS